VDCVAVEFTLTFHYHQFFALVFDFLLILRLRSHAPFLLNGTSRELAVLHGHVLLRRDDQVIFSPRPCLHAHGLQPTLLVLDQVGLLGLLELAFALDGAQTAGFVGGRLGAWLQFGGGRLSERGGGHGL